MGSGTKDAPWTCQECAYENSSLFLNCAMCGHSVKRAGGSERHRQLRAGRVAGRKGVIDERTEKGLTVIDGQRRVAQRQAKLLEVIVNRVVELEERAAHEEKMRAGRSVLLLLGTM